MTRSRVFVWALGLATAGAAAWFGYRAFAAHRVTQETHRLAEVLSLRPSSRVADVGAGNGAFTIELASRVVPEGHVFATEIEGRGVAAIRARVGSAGLTNVTALQAAEDSSNLPAECCDAVFLRGVYHHIREPAKTNHSLRNALRPNGRLAIVDFEPSWFLSTFFPVEDVPEGRGGHGIAPEVVIAELQQAGFTLVSRLDDWTGGLYCLVFDRRGPDSQRQARLLARGQGARVP